MSASLVGSEMCIRDRCSSPLPARARLGRFGRPVQDHSRVLASPTKAGIEGDWRARAQQEAIGA
eukprot:6433321-Alexandrium_andersonii.AAC.1